MNKYFLIIIGTILPLVSFSQHIDLLKVEKRLNLSERIANVKIVNPESQIFDIEGLTKNERTSSHHLILNKNHLIINLNGLGKLYGIDRAGKLNRIDSTEFQGSTFGAFFTSFKDTLLQIGGYGFWQITGGIRHFQFKYHEWNIYKTNQDVRISTGINCLAFEDVKNNKVYFIYKDVNPEYLIKNQSSKLKVQCLDLKTKLWWGNAMELNPVIGKNIKDLGLICPVPRGLIISSVELEKTILVDFHLNKIYSVQDEFITEIVQAKGVIGNHISYTDKNFLNLYDYKNDSVSHFELKEKYLKPLNHPLFLAENKTYQLFTARNFNYLLLGIISGLLLFYFSKKRKNNSASLIKKEDIENKNDFDAFVKLLEKEELIILKTIMKNQLTDKKNTTIQELNEKTELDKKPMKIQNNLRANYILEINKKYSKINSAKEELVQRVRSDFDKRYFEYKINPRAINQLKHFL